jgi:predicted nucleic acid-binding protein
LTGYTLDAGALIAIERDDRTVNALLTKALARQSPLTVPAPVAAQVVRNLARQARIARWLYAAQTTIVPFDKVSITEVGRLLARSGASDVVDAHVVLCAQRAEQTVVTSDPDDLRRIDPDLAVVAV